MSKLAERIKRIKLIKALVYSVVGSLSYPGLTLRNKMTITGMEHLEHLPNRNVLFVSNHQTYFMDVIALLHVFCARKWGKRNKLGVPYYLLSPYTNVHYVAAEETITKDWITRVYSLAGAIPVKRTWVQGGKEVRRGLDPSDTRKVERILDRSWVITFPQGTTKPYAPGRKGTAFIIKKNQPIVIPVVLGGFWRAFKKKGIGVRKAGTQLTIQFKPPMDLDYNESTERILEQVMEAIEQSPDHALKGRHQPQD